MTELLTVVKLAPCCHGYTSSQQYKIRAKTPASHTVSKTRENNYPNIQRLNVKMKMYIYSQFSTIIQKRILI